MACAFPGALASSPVSRRIVGELRFYVVGTTADGASRTALRSFARRALFEYFFASARGIHRALPLFGERLPLLSVLRLSLNAISEPAVRR